MPNPKKLIRESVTPKLNIDEWVYIVNRAELEKLYALKIQEERDEIVNATSPEEQLAEFADLLDVLYTWAALNGFTSYQLVETMNRKRREKGHLRNIALTNLNPNNPSNKVYFDDNATKTGVKNTPVQKAKK